MCVWISDSRAEDPLRLSSLLRAITTSECPVKSADCYYHLTSTLLMFRVTTRKNTHCYRPLDGVHAVNGETSSEGESLVRAAVMQKVLTINKFA